MGRDSVDIIKSGGYKISAPQIEDAILSHPDISECAVMGAPDEALGETVAAVIAFKSNQVDCDLPGLCIFVHLCRLMTCPLGVVHLIHAPFAAFAVPDFCSLRALVLQPSCPCAAAKQTCSIGNRVWWLISRGKKVTAVLLDTVSFMLLVCRMNSVTAYVLSKLHH